MGGELQLEHFMLGWTQTLSTMIKPMLESTTESSTTSDNPLSLYAGLSVAEAEKLLINETLKYTNDNRTKASEMLGISIRTLRNKLQEYKMEP